MKKPIFLFAILISINAIVYSQPCLPDGITFSTQTQIDSFQTNYPSCTEIEGSVRIEGDDITDLFGLTNLVSIGGYLEIYENKNLNNLEGLNNLVSIGGQLDISYNNNLYNLEGLNNLTSLGGTISISSNNSLTSISALSNTAFSDDEDNWRFVEIIDNGALINLEGLNSIDTIGDHLAIDNNDSLTSLSGLQNLKCITGYLHLDHNYALTSLEGLNNLNRVNSWFRITRNNALTNLEGLNNLTTLMYGFTILKNDSLTSLSGLNNLTSTKNIWLENNPMLTDITALASVESNLLGNLTIKTNPLLTNCDIESICSYLMLPNSDVKINNNATGCNSEEEVIAACTEGVSETSPKPVFTIYPNPATKNLFISSDNELVNAITIYNQLGKKVIFKTKPIDKIDVSMLKQGIYIIEIASNKLKIRDKLIIQ